jgi:mercuric ion transport protein
MLISNLIPSFGVVSSLGAIASKACCVLPLVLAGAGAAAGSVAVVQALVPLQTPLLALSVLLIGAGWISYWRPVVAAKPDPNCDCAPKLVRWSRRDMIVLSIATLLLATAIAWDVIQPSSIMQMAT